MMLNELARELKKTLDFDYLTIHGNYDEKLIVTTWKGRPNYNDRGKIWKPVRAKSFFTGAFYEANIKDLDLSEYRDESGNLDFSKCMVEMKE